MLIELKTKLKYLLSQLLYRFPSPQLRKERLYLYMDMLYKTRDLPGSVVEVGCFQGATAAYAVKFLEGIERPRHYVCIDTFDGFVPAQFDTDVAFGTVESERVAFSSNSKQLVRKLLNQWNCPDVELIQADVTHLAASALPEQIAVALVDVDIAEPTAAALRLIVPRMVPGGVILIDDCDGRNYAGAMKAVMDFASDSAFQFGMGVISLRRSATSAVVS